MIITENGWSDNGEINDTARITYFREHLKQLLDALLNDECNVKGYSGTSLGSNLIYSNKSAKNYIFKIFQFHRSLMGLNGLVAIRRLQKLIFIFHFHSISILIYSEKFGLFAVNVTSPQKDRIPKLSASYIDRLIDTRQVPESNWNEKVAAENAGENSQENIPSNVIY